MDWDHLKYFHTIAKTGSLTKAAKALKVNHSTVSRRLKALEKSLHTRLFDKILTGTQLTPSGKSLFKHTLAIEIQVNEARQALEGRTEHVCGRIKLSTEDIFGYKLLPDFIDKFRKKYPDVTIDQTISSSYANLSQREADVVITIRKKPPEHLVGRRLGTVKIFLAASKSYLKRHGTPKEVKDLANHHILCPNDSLGHLGMVRWLHKNISDQNIVFMSDKLLALYHMAKRNMGIAPMPNFLIDSDKDIIPLIPLPDNCSAEAWVLTHPDLRDTLAIKMFIKFIGDNFKI